LSEVQPKPAPVPEPPPTTPQREIDGDTYRFTPHLKILNADRYRVYPSLSPTIRISFCWAHQRRDFTDFLTAYPQQREGCQWADQWIKRIANLYQLNEQRLAVLADPPAFALTQAKLEQAIAQIDLLVAKRATLPAPQRKILDSMHEHCSGRIIFVEDPAIPMDNNYAERLIRTPVIGRKNFAGHQTQQAGKLGAILYSIVLTCQLHDISPFDFLGNYFNKCANEALPLPI
jgi:transposase